MQCAPVPKSSHVALEHQLDEHNLLCGMNYAVGNYEGEHFGNLHGERRRNLPPGARIRTVRRCSPDADAIRIILPYPKTQLSGAQ